MPGPLPFILAPLILGSAYAAGRHNAERKQQAIDERIDKVLGLTGTGQPAQPEVAQPPSRRATEPVELGGTGTPAPAEPEAPTGPPTPPTSGGGPPIRPGEVTDMPVQPTRQLTDPNARMYVKGMSVNPVTGNMNIQYARDEQQLNAEWFNQFQRNKQTLEKDNPRITPLEADSQAIARTIRLTGRLPSAQVLTLLDPERREQVSQQVYWKAVWQIMNSSDVRRALSRIASQEGTELSPNGLDPIVMHYALRVITDEMGGYMPEDVRKVLINMEAPPLDEDTANKAFELFGIRDPRHITQAQAGVARKEVLRERAGQAGAEAQAQELGRERAEQQIFAQEQGQPAGPITREAEKRRALGEVDIELADQIPVSRQTAEALQLPVGTTMGEVKQRGLIEVPQWVQQNRSDVWNAQSQLDALQSYAGQLITADPELVSVLKQAATLKWERLMKTNPRAAVYKKLAEGLLSIMARNAASERGVLTNQDIDRARQLMVGDFSSAEEMRLMFEELRGLFENRLANAEKAALPQQAKGRATKRYNPETGKVEEIK